VSLSASSTLNSVANDNRVVASVDFPGVNAADRAALVPWLFAYNTTSWSVAFLGE
jgi:hypothetical protein